MPMRMNAVQNILLDIVNSEEGGEVPRSNSARATHATNGGAEEAPGNEDDAGETGGNQQMGQ